MTVLFLFAAGSTAAGLAAPPPKTTTPPPSPVAAAEERLEWVFRTGGTPFAMYFRPAEDRRTKIPPEWNRFVRRWNRPALIFSSHADYLADDVCPESAPALVGTGASEGEVR